MNIPLLDQKRQLKSIRSEIDQAITRVVDSACFILGPEVERFEENLARYCHARFAIGCASGSDALLISLLAAGVTAGDYVITTAYSFYATAAAVLRLGASPVFVDIDPGTFNLDTGQLKDAMKYKPSAIIPVHMFGQMCAMDEIREIVGDTPIIEDAAQAVGALWRGEPIGTYSTASCLSFYPSKNLGAFGDGGAIVTNNPQMAEACRMLRAHGAREGYYHEYLGMNSRLDALQAAVLNVKLTHLDEWIECRRHHARVYDQAFEQINVRSPAIHPEAFSVYNQYTIQVENRDALRCCLDTHGIGNAVYYPVPLPQQPCFASLNTSGEYPVSLAAAESCLSIPVFPELSSQEQIQIIDVIQAFVMDQQIH